MAVPKRKHSNARTGSRRSQDGKKPASMARCPECGKVNLNHTVCANCGYYMGRKVVSTEE
ncbi:MAG: 50S ribosomal protein L32 [Thermoguttaceae bacterium]|nr:50S ribosomal protein L32 [Thermoguttaceae bacterium]MBQ6618607.1 50S ribosomal protein L32 [Thermoguttaceae bacterium]MBR2586517.1 50S ribosomal protein L32 [Thermoguttaceae bacterium]MBR3220136.1 50S ribosomal protein L32 [Thermoguttaceae bacterium]